MSWIVKTLTSSIGKKMLMAITGMFLVTFLIVHLIGNLQIFSNDDGYKFNSYAAFMTTFPLIRVISIVNMGLILFHAFWGLYLEYYNRKARPIDYYVKKNNQSSVYSRNMSILGTLILVFIVMHLSQMWYEYHYEDVPYKRYTENLITGEVSASPMPENYTQAYKILEMPGEPGVKTTIIKDLRMIVQVVFQNPLIVLFYIFSLIPLAYHLIHGFHTVFQSLGLNHKKYSPFIKFVGLWLIGILMPLGYALMPLYVYFSK